MSSSGREDQVWVFGYGSLAHTPNFAFSNRAEGYIRGFRRVFWQGSTDHRGTPQRPGRTVTLTPDPAACTWGVAFALSGSPEEQAAALQYLEWREKQYDERVRLDLYDKNGQVVVQQALVYIASPRNANYLGPAELPTVAKQIATTAGPSGHNSQYLFRLADTMRSMGVEDPELYELERLVRQVMDEHGDGQVPVVQEQLGSACGVAVAEAAGACRVSVEAAAGTLAQRQQQQQHSQHQWADAELERQMRQWHQRQVERPHQEQQQQKERQQQQQQQALGGEGEASQACIGGHAEVSCKGQACGAAGSHQVPVQVGAGVGAGRGALYGGGGGCRTEAEERGASGDARAPEQAAQVKA